MILTHDEMLTQARRATPVTVIDGHDLTVSHDTPLGAAITGGLTTIRRLDPTATQTPATDALVAAIARLEQTVANLPAILAAHQAATAPPPAPDPDTDAMERLMRIAHEAADDDTPWVLVSAGRREALARVVTAVLNAHAYTDQ